MTNTCRARKSASESVSELSAYGGGGATTRANSLALQNPKVAFYPHTRAPARKTLRKRTQKRLRTR